MDAAVVAGWKESGTFGSMEVGHREGPKSQRLSLARRRPRERLLLRPEVTGHLTATTA